MTTRRTDDPLGDVMRGFEQRLRKVENHEHSSGRNSPTPGAVPFMVCEDSVNTFVSGVALTVSLLDTANTAGAATTSAGGRIVFGDGLYEVSVTVLVSSSGAGGDSFSVATFDYAGGLPNIIGPLSAYDEALAGRRMSHGWTIAVEASAGDECEVRVIQTDTLGSSRSGHVLCTVKGPF